ncbi:DUF1997 domain-containing protein [Phormidesmis priestleyi]|uniref:DUF1997 domain-containing protein n=1 Tax=Phormidesmis priestleyi TaxID=268141 RepID=UPI00083B77AD|nr:DUF1997 domain-containing protein [Phormidesmis priestleyi]
MQSQPTDHQFIQTAHTRLPHLSDLNSTSLDATQSVTEPTQFCSHFVDSMDMYADLPTVSSYLDAHSDWFHRCAHPMQVDSIGRNSYALTVGSFGAFGYEVEPKVGLDLLPQNDGVYRIETVPVPGYSTPSYEVDFRAALELVEGTHPATKTGSASDKMTQVQWQLDLTVTIQFPRFIQALPEPIIQRTGDRVLRQVVRQVSRRLTQRVQEDFHASHGLSMPKRSRKWL